METWTSEFLLWGLYPAWLLAGACDYLCHRRTDIAHTTGAAESWLHLAQFISLAVVFACAVLLQINAAVYAAMVAFVFMHSVISFVDVSYTDGRRRIPPIEQFAHGLMDVLPLVAVAMLGVEHWREIRTGPNAIVLAGPVSGRHLLTLSSFVLLAGVPIFEELWRTSRADHALRHRRSIVTPASPP
jgi:hypothetical protein